jgi:hypothetical protein
MRRAACSFALTVAIGVAAFACASFDEPGATADSGTGDGAASPDGGSSGDGGAAKVVFVGPAVLTSAQVADADALCLAAMQQVFPSRRARAWVYRDDLSPLQRMGSAQGPWTTPTGRPLFLDRAALTSAAPANPIDETLDGKSIGGEKFWTGLLPDGGPSGIDCQKWKSTGTGDEATVGIVGSTEPSWASTGRVLCSEMHPIICIEY